MCTIGRTAGGTAGKAHHRTDRAQYPVWNGQERKDNGAKQCRSSFLNTTFLPRPLPNLFVEDTGGNRYNLITQENYEFLRDSYSGMPASWERKRYILRDVHSAKESQNCTKKWKSLSEKN